jgi:hypothetical protein
MVDANHVVAPVQTRLLAPVQVRPGREYVGETGADDVALEAAEEVKFVAEDWPADGASILVLVGIGLALARLQRRTDAP